MVATLNQPQYSPWPMEEQVIALFAGNEGYLDNVPVAQVPRFQEEVREHLRAEGTVYKTIRETGELDEETEKRLREELDKFLNTFNVEEDRGARLIAHSSGTQAARPRDHEHAQADQGDGARRLGALAARAGADRGDAPVRGPDDGADGGNRACELVRPRPAAAAAARRRDRGDRARDGRPRPRGRLQRADPPPRHRAYNELQGQGVDVRWLPVGRKGISTLRFSRYELDGQWGGFSDNPHYDDAQTIAHRLAELYANGDVDRVVLVYNHFVSPLVQQVTVSDVLPISEDVLETERGRA